MACSGNDAASACNVCPEPFASAIVAGSGALLGGPDDDAFYLFLQKQKRGIIIGATQERTRSSNKHWLEQ